MDLFLCSSAVTLQPCFICTYSLSKVKIKNLTGLENTFKTCAMLYIPTPQAAILDWCTVRAHTVHW